MSPFTICRLIGCRSVFARWFEWPNRLCYWRSMRAYKKESA